MRALIIALGTVAVVLVAAVAAAVLLIDASVFKPRIVDAVKRATGRDITIAGRINIEPNFPPTFSAEGVSIANIPGGTRPQMATIRRVEAQLGLLPLLSGRIVVERLVIQQPDILLETDVQGTPNWRFTRPATPENAPGSATGNGAGSQPSDAAAPRQPFAIQAIHVRDGVVSWREGRTQRVVKLALEKLDGTTPSTDSAVVLSGEGNLAGIAFTLTAQTGPLTRLLDRTATTLWPLQATLIGGGGARLAVSGGLTDPGAGRGYTLVVEGEVANLGTLERIGGRLPRLRNVTLSARVSDNGGGVPDVSQLRLRAGPSDLGDSVPGLVLDRSELTLSGPSDPMHAETHGTLSGTPLDVVASLGAPRRLLAPIDTPGGTPFPIDVNIDVAGAKLTAKGGIASPVTLTGLDIAVRGSIADLRALGPLAGRRLPALRDISLTGRVADGPGGTGRSIVLSGITLAMAQADLAGDAVLTLGVRPRLQATLVSKLIDIDALLAALPPAEPPAPAPAPAAIATAAGAAVPVPAPAPAPVRRVFSDLPLPFGILRLADADLALTLGEVRSQGVSYRDLAGHAVVEGGKLTLDPFAGETPSGRLEATLTVDAMRVEPPVALTLHAPGLAMKPVLAAFGLPDDVNGLVAIDADLHGAGNTPHTLMAGIDGRLGLALVDGDIDNRTIAALAGDVLRAARLPVDLGGAGRTRLRCFALRLDAVSGTAAVGALVLDTSRLLLQGSGTLALGDESLALRLRPVLRLGSGTGVAVPVRAGGTLRDPKITIDAGGALEATLGAAAGRGVSPSGADRNGDLCPAALTAARDGHAGAMPNSPPGPASAGPTGRINPADLLRGLVR